MVQSDENTASPYAPPAVPSHVEEAPVGMVAVVQDRELANYLKIRRQTPVSCLICLGVVGFWTSFISTLVGGTMFFIPPPPQLAVPLLSAVATLAAGALTALPFIVLAVLRPQRRLAISAKGLSVLSAELVVFGTIWMLLAVPSGGEWDVLTGMMFWTAPLWFFLPFGLLNVWVNRYGTKRLAEAGLSERAVALKGGRIYDFPRDAEPSASSSDAPA